MQDLSFIQNVAALVQGQSTLTQHLLSFPRAFADPPNEPPEGMEYLCLVSSPSEVLEDFGALPQEGLCLIGSLSPAIPPDLAAKRVQNLCLSDVVLESPSNVDAASQF